MGNDLKVNPTGFHNYCLRLSDFIKKQFLLLFLKMPICVGICICACSALTGQKGALDPLGAGCELQDVDAGS